MAAQLTGGTDLLTYYDLVFCYKKYINQTIDPTLSSYVADLPGKTTVEADGYVVNLLRDPHIKEDSGNTIQPFDTATLKDAYHLKEGPIPGFDFSLIGTDDGLTQDRAMEKHGSGGGGFGSDSERKHRKKKKKRKHSHDHHDEEGSHGDHKKKRKRKKERDHSSRRDENESASVIVD